VDGKPCKGVIVRGAKVCNSNAPYVDEIIALPTKFMAEGDESYAIAFVLPGDWDGIKLMALPSKHHSRKHIDAPIGKVGDVESLTIFDDVLVPEDRIFLNGYDNPGVLPYAGYLALMFAHYHRHSYTGCKTAVSEVFAAQAALVADVNDIAKQAHVREKICDSIEGPQMVAGMHGGGSPLMETITMMNRYDLEPLKDIAKYLSGFEGVKLPRYERATATPRAMLAKFEQAQKKNK
jgi:4-hydroxybutyryl-CoA dehydratase / vinylacetyl-CoA-Delta-isomerase